MADEIRTDHIYQRAHALAEGGIHQSPAEIVAALLAEGYPEAAELLNSDADPEKPATWAFMLKPLARAT